MFIYKHKFYTLRRGLSITGDMKVHGHGKIIAGYNLNFRAVVSTTELYADKGASIIIGDNVTINEGSIISTHQLIEIGDESLISGAIIYDTDWHGIDGKKAKLCLFILVNMLGLECVQLSWKELLLETMPL